MQDYFKAINDPEDRFFQADDDIIYYNERYVTGKPNTVNWASKVKKLLSSMGYYEVWIAQRVGNKNAFLSDMKTRLRTN